MTGDNSLKVLQLESGPYEFHPEKIFVLSTKDGKTRCALLSLDRLPEILNRAAQEFR